MPPSPAPDAQPHPYASRAYAEALGQGEPVAPPSWGGFVLRRPIPGGGFDAAGPYPLTVLAGDADLPAGLAALAASGLVSLVVTPDPLCGPGEPAWRAACRLHRPFKTHSLIDPAAGPYDPSRHHRDRIRRGLRRCRLERVALQDRLEDWRGLYAGLVAAKAIQGAAAFPSAYFDRLAAEPALEAFAAFVGDEVAAMTLWFAHDGIVYNHLTTSSTLGYANGAAFALYDAAIAHFSGEGVINLGAGAGLNDDPENGLAQFKRGFANSAVQGWLCGAVLDPERYAALSTGRETTFFPAYRG